MKKPNKFLYGYAIYVNYGQGWEYESFETTWGALKTNLTAYRENCPYPVKWNAKREKNPEYSRQA